MAWSCHESSPSSLQVREGLGSDGSHAVLAGGDMDGWMPKPHIDIETFFIFGFHWFSRRIFFLENFPSSRNHGRWVPPNVVTLR